MNTAKGFRVIGTYGQQRYLGGTTPSNVLESIKVRAVSRVIDPPALVLENKAAVPAMMVPQRAGAPMFARCQCDLPVAMRKAFPPFQFHHAGKTQIIR